MRKTFLMNISWENSLAKFTEAEKALFLTRIYEFYTCRELTDIPAHMERLDTFWSTIEYNLNESEDKYSKKLSGMETARKANPKVKKSQQVYDKTFKDTVSKEEKNESSVLISEKEETITEPVKTVVVPQQTSPIQEWYITWKQNNSKLIQQDQYLESLGDILHTLCDASRVPKHLLTNEQSAALLKANTAMTNFN